MTTAARRRNAIDAVHDRIIELVFARLGRRAIQHKTLQILGANGHGHLQWPEPSAAPAHLLLGAGVTAAQAMGLAPFNLNGG